MTTCTDKAKTNWVRMILRAKKRLRAHLKRKKSHGMVMFIYMNWVHVSALQPLNAHG